VKTLSKTALLRASAAPMILGAALVSNTAFAQQAEDAASGDAIIVTGSLIKNPNLSQATPVNTTTADQVELKQSNTAEEILREIPGVVPSIGSAVNNGNGGASFVDLRGLGSNRNIVLLDGVRLVPSGLVGRVDLNNIPLALVDRVDVLTGGASTTYGADAISGVVNFVTKQDFAGIEALVSEQITEQGDGNYLRADVTMGANFDDGRGNAVFSIGYQESDPVYQGDRSFSFNNISSFTGGASGSGTSVPSRFSNINITGQDHIAQGCGGTTGVTCVTRNATRQVNPAAGAFSTTTQLFNFNPYNIFQTPFQRFNMYGSAKYDVSDALTVYTRGLFSKNTVNTIIAPSGAFNISVVVPLSNPYLTTALRNGFCQFDTTPGVGYTPLYSPAVCAAAATATNPTDPNYRTVTTNLSLRAVDVGPRISEFQTTIFDYRLGFKGGITDTIDWDVFGAYGESENTQTQQNYTLNSRFRQALLATNTTTCLTDTGGCVPVNVFGGTGSITPAQAAFLTADSVVSVKTTLAQARGTISGDIGVASPWASDAISFAVAGEYRKYTAAQRSDLLSQSGDLGGAGGAAPNITGGYDVYEAIGEVAVPLIQDKPFFEELSVNAGIRYSHYGVDSPNSPTFNATTYKVEGNWSPVPGLKLRGNYAHAVRAPNINELFSPVNTGLTSLQIDPCAGAAPTTNANLRAVCLAQGAPAGTIGSIANPTAQQANATSGGNLNLKPETSNSYGFGATFQPEFLPGFSASVDYYNIKVKGAITTPSPTDAINACFGSLTAASASNPACTIIRRNPTTGGLDGDPSTTPGLFLALSNLGYLKTDGIDVYMNYNHDLGWGNLALAVTGNWTNSSVFQASPTSPARDCVGLFSVNCASIQPKFQWSVRPTLTVHDVDLSVLWRHIDGVEYEFANDPDPANRLYSGPVAALGGKTYDFNKISSYDYFDLTLRFHATENVTITTTVQNLFDKKPPIVGSGAGTTAFNSGNTYPSTYDSLGRRYAVSAKLKF